MSLTSGNQISVPPEYWEVRKAATNMFRKVIQDPSLASMSMLKAAKRLGIRTAGKTIVFEDRTDQAALAEYFLHDYIVDGKPAIQKVNASALNLTPLETEVLEAARQSSATLFRTVESYPQQCQLRILDVLEQNASEITLTDVSLSQTFAHWAAKGLIFARCLKVRDLAITGMFSYVFELENGQRMMQALFQKLKNKTEEEWAELKFQFFFQMHRRYGLPSRYLESDFSPAPPAVVPSAEPSGPSTAGDTATPAPSGPDPQVANP
jgi:hypothetical protein